MKFELTKSLPDGFPSYREYRGEEYALFVTDFGESEQLKFIEAVPLNIHWPKISFKMTAPLCSFELHPFSPEDMPEMAEGMRKAQAVYQYILENYETI